MTLRRHKYYCRSRKSAVETPRSRSCKGCSKRKLRCDNKRPACSRCVAKATECQYPTSSNIKSSPSRRSQNAQCAPTEASLLVTGSVPSEQHSSEATPPEHLFRDRNLQILDPADTTDLDFDWAKIDMGFLNQLDFQGNQNYNPQIPTSSPQSPWLRPLDRHASRRTSAVLSINATIPPSLDHTSRQIIIRPKVQTSTKRVSELIWHILKSYLLMHTTVLPPCLHSSLLSQHEEDLDTEPINNCLTLMRLFRAGDRASRRLFWKNVRLECERFFDEVR